MLGPSLDPRRPGNALSVRSFYSVDDPPTRREKAFAAIEGRPQGMLEGNPWSPIFDFDSSVVGAIMASGGLVFTFQLSDPISVSDTDRLAALWDDEVVADGPMVVRQGARVTVVIPEVKGQRLSLWCTSLLAATPVDQQPLSQLGAVRAREATAAAAKDKEPGAVQSAFSAWMKANTTLGVVAIVVGGAVAYFMFGPEIKAALGGLGGK